MKEGPATAAGVEYRVAQSGDATCNGLFSATEGSRTMSLKRESCQMVEFFDARNATLRIANNTGADIKVYCVNVKASSPSGNSVALRNATLRIANNTGAYIKVYCVNVKASSPSGNSVALRNAKLRIANNTGADTKVYCVTVKASSPSGNSVALVAHWQHHCASRYVCVVLYRRDTFIAELQRGSPTARPDEACSPRHFNAVTAPYVTLVGEFPSGCLLYRRDTFVAELQRGSPTARPDEACSPRYFNAVTAPYVTLVASNPESKECPYSGKYAIENNQHSRRKRSLESHESVRRKRDKTTEHRRVNGTRLFNFSVSNMSEAPMLRSKRQSDGSEVSCVVNKYNKLEVGCNSVKNMEFYSTCQSKEYVTVYFLDW
ncbi:Uncharacterized protein OBRU01_23552, partial [Operophtera brumata]